MRYERILGILILGDFILGVLSLVTGFALESFLPASLRGYFVAEGAAAPRLTYTWLTVLWVVVVIGTVLAWIGLLSLLRAARPLYLGSWGAYLLVIWLSGPVVSTALGHVVQILMALVGGTIVGVIYFSELRTKFRKVSEALAGGVERAA